MTDRLSHPFHPKYRPDIDGLRAVAVLAVVAFHAFPSSMKGGFIGVDVFFVISGYLISTIIFESLDKGAFSFRDFYARRIKRIFPALTFVLLSCFAFGWFFLLADEFNQLGKHIAAGAGFVSNFVLMGEAGYFDNSAETKPLLHLWSLGIEEQFYIVWPVLLWFVWKQKFNLLSMTVVLAIVSFALNIKGIKHDAVGTFYLPQNRFWELLSGSILAWLTLYQKDAFAKTIKKTDGFLAAVIYKDAQAPDGKTLANLISFAGLLLLVYGFWRINKDFSFPGKWALVPVMGAVFVVAAGPKTWINRTILSNKIAVWFGLISFPLYLWHWPILSFGRIIYSETPPAGFRLLAVLVSILLAWLTVKIVEKPFRFGNKRSDLKVATLCSLVFAMGVSGYAVSKTDFSHSHTYQKLAVKRKGFEHAYGPSLAWIEGKDDWLFLGNAYDDTVAKLKLSVVPSNRDLKATVESFSKIAEAGAQHGAKVILIVGPNKSSIYPEYLPNELSPSAEKYSSLFFDKLKDVPNLTVYNPTNDFLRLKESEGLLYWKTDTHWNAKGSFLAYSGFSNLLGLSVPKVAFERGPAYKGDLVDISKLKDFPLHADDSWDIVWKNARFWTENEIPDQQKTAFGLPTVSVNENPLSNQYVWVVGDSFSIALKHYFNATFKEVRYVGHWTQKFKELPEDLVKADRKPDMVVVVRVERSF